MTTLKLIKNLVPKTFVYQQHRFKMLKVNSHVKVTLCGAATQIGQPLGLLLKQSPYIDELALYDNQQINSLAMELSQVDTNCTVNAYSQSGASEAFENASIVIIVSGIHVVGHRALDKVFPKNAVLVQQIAAHVARHCPKALIAVGTNPVEALVPVVTERLRFAGVYDPRRVFGITTINVIRANTFAANILGLEPEYMLVPVIGGNIEGAIVPILSQALPCSEFTPEEIEDIADSLQNAHEALDKARTHDGPTLTSAFGIARFAISLVKGLKGYDNVLEYAFIRTNDVGSVKYFSVPLFLGPNGVKKDLGMPLISSFEQCLVEKSVPLIKQWVKKGNEFVGVIDLTDGDPCATDTRMEPYLCKNDV